MTKVSIDLPDFHENYQYTGEFRAPEIGEMYLGISASGCKIGGCLDAGYHVLKCQSTGMGPSIIVKRVRPRYDNYYFIDDAGDVVCTQDMNIHMDDNRYKFGNYFRTEPEALIMAASIKETLLSRC